uniref:Immunoglobulin heavy constant mu n=1 Tax=Loxodonta africana TaxID=9785 RepID=G3UMK9_LOXAF
FFYYWGQGTMVTVSSESSSSPTLFPLVSCESSDESQVALGCLAHGFLPDSIKFSWDYKNNSAIDIRKYKTFPSVLQEGKYLASSQVLLPSVDVLQDPEDYLMCKVQHPKENKNLKVPLPGPKDPISPNVTVYIPPRDSFSGQPRTSKLSCWATGFSPKQISLVWLRDGKPVLSGFTTGEAEPEPKPSEPRLQTFQINSMLTISESDWLNQIVFTCVARHQGEEVMKNVSSVCGPSQSPSINIFTTPPSFAGIFLTKSAKLSCLVTGLATYESLNISWTRENGEALKTDLLYSESFPNATFSVTGKATVCLEDWESGEKFMCIVTHTDLPSPLKQTMSKPKEVVKQQPAVYLMPPTREQLSLRESASITCLVKAFSPPDVFVQWLQKGQPVASDSYVTSNPMPEPQTKDLYFAYSILNVSEEEWSAGDTFTCVVGHEALPHLVTERTVDKSTGKPSLYNVSLVMSDTANTCF